jgi:hypothetical protein
MIDLLNEVESGFPNVEVSEVAHFVGCWLLAVGCWLLAIGCWLKAKSYYITALNLSDIQLIAIVFFPSFFVSS